MRKQLFVLAGLAGAVTMTASSQAAIITVSSLTLGTVDGTYQTAVLTVSGLTGALEAVAGTSSAPMSFTTGDGSGFFNQDTVIFGGFPIFNGSSAFAAGDTTPFGAPNGQFDSGALDWAGIAAGVPGETNVSPGFVVDEMGSFDFTQGGDDSTTNGAIFDFDPGTPVTGTVDLFRLTWKMNTTMTYAFGIAVSGVDENEALGGTIIPTPGALALLGLAGLTGIRRRRRA